MRVDDAQFDALHAALAGEVYRYAARRTAHDMAEDVVSETFEALWKGRHRIPARHDEQRAWAFGVARNQLALAQRLEARHRGLGLRLVAALHGGVPVHHADVAVDVLDGDAARRAWRMLDPRDQEVLSLVAWEGLRPQEVAHVLGISVTAVTSRVARARRRLDSLQRLTPGELP